MNLKNKLITSAIILGSLFSISSVYAKDVAFSGDEKKEFLTKFEKNHPGIFVDEINKTEIPNILELVVDKTNILYVDSSAKYLFYGHIIVNDNGNSISLTEKRVEELSKFNLNDLNLDNAIVTIKGNGENKIVTFEDPNCVFCQKLHPELDKLDNVTIYTFVIPILGPSSVEVSKQIWCSENKSLAWNKYMTTKELKNIDINSCDVKALDENIEFAKNHNISGTPAIFFENGKGIKGYVNSDKLLEAMTAN